MIGMTTTSQPLRRPSVSIYDYPEELNPFRDEPDDQDNVEAPTFRKYHNIVNNNIPLKVEKDTKNKFWTFGRSRKKRSNSFSIKSTWNGIFGKKKNVDETDRKPTITTVSSTYKRATYNDYPNVPHSVSKDQQEFDEALGTLTRRRKNTLDSSSRYSSSLTVNGEPGRIYNGSPQETTASIMGDLTPKPPARRFGQVTSRPTDQIPPLIYNESCKGDGERTPVPPKRGELRSSYRYNPTSNQNNEGNSKSTFTITDENENMPEEYVFKRCNHDTIRKSNLSINSSVSMTSVYHSGRKKRRAPPPPEKKPETLQPPKETIGTNVEQVNKETIEAITKVAENINEMTRKNLELNDDEIKTTLTAQSVESKDNKVVDDNDRMATDNFINENVHRNEEKIESELRLTIEKADENSLNIKSEKENVNEVENLKEVIPVRVELKKEEETIREIVKEVEIIDDADDEVTFRKKIPENHSSNDSFSVKEEIEKIERQIKILEAKGALETKQRTRTYSLTDDDDILGQPAIQRGHFSRRSLQEHRRNFFKELTRTSENGVKIEIKELPREQKDIKIVRLNDDLGVSVDCEQRRREERHEPIKVIERHISEPIKQKPEFNVDLEFNPIPKPRRHNSLRLNNNYKNNNCNHNDNNNNSNNNNNDQSKDKYGKEEKTSSL